MTSEHDVQDVPGERLIPGGVEATLADVLGINP